ncbi:FtsX-like permease family protein [Clostridium paraputrificum]|uniref:FtsX-like permease family protein n=1 Tax=Clostridium paraputrificum TaxID=29363 RepID=UPI003D33A6EB
MNFRNFATNNVIRNARAYLGYFLSTTISAALLFSFTMIIFHPDLELEVFPEYLQRGFWICITIAYLFLCFFIFYSVSVFLKGRFKEFGTLFILGISDKQIKKMITIENLIITSTASVIGVILGLVFSKILLLTSGKLLGYEMLKFYIPLKAIIITLIGFIIIGIVISLFSTFIIGGDKVLKLLKGSCKPKSEPKTSTILAIICVLLLVSGYFLALTSSTKNLMNRMLPVTTVVIIGTYLLFSHLSIFIIKTLKKNRKFYMKNTSMLWVSNLLYRIKDNTRMFFLLTITTAVAFTAIGGVSAFWINKEKEIEDNFPQAFFYAIGNKDTNKPFFIEEELKMKDYQYDRVIGNIKNLYSEEGDSINVINESTYNDLATSLGQEVINISENEAVEVAPEIIKARKGIAVNSNELLVVNRIYKRVLPALYDTIYIVSDKVYPNINIPEIDFYSYNVEDYKLTLDICNSYNNKYKDYESRKESISLMKADLLEAHKLSYGVVMFMCIFIGLIFFVTTSSFIYNKYYMDISEDKVKYRNLNKIGLTFKEIKSIATIEIGVLFLFPYVVAMSHSIFALNALKSTFGMEVNMVAFMVMGSFFMVQILYFLIIRGNYLIEMKRELIHNNI